MKLYSYESVPNLDRRTVDMANADIVAYHVGKRSFDTVFANVVDKAQERVHLELFKMRRLGETVVDGWWKFGYVPKTAVGFDERLDAERLLVERHALKAAKKFNEADAVRKRLESWGYEISDEQDGTNWVVKV